MKKFIPEIDGFENDFVCHTGTNILYTEKKH